MTMKIILLTCIWERKNLTELFLKYLSWTQQKLNDKLIISVVVVGSNPEDEELVVNKYDFTYLNHINQPLSEKWQAGLDHIADCNYDALLILGSDDFLALDIFDCYIDFLKNSNSLAFGFSDCYFLDLIERKWVYWPGYGKTLKDRQPHRMGEPIGAGRLIKREAMLSIAHNLWRGSMLNKGLDKYAYDILSSITLSDAAKVIWEIKSLRQLNRMMIDVKVGQSVTKYKAFQIEQNDEYSLEYYIYNKMRENFPSFVVSDILDLRASLRHQHVRGDLIG